MQLHKLLESLSPEERAQLLERRRVPDADATDNGTLTRLLCRSDNLLPVFLDLNNFQLLLLRWLAGRPRLEAPWKALLEALQQRVSPDYVVNQARELRLLGLVDFKASSDGFVVTYPAVVSALPLRHTVRLKDHLEGLNSEQARQIVGAMGVKHAPTHKADRIETIAANLSSNETIRPLVNGLSEAARSLFEWVRSEGGSVSPDQMCKRLGVKAYDLSESDPYYYGRSPKRGLESLMELRRVCLVVPASRYYYAADFYSVPHEVELAYSAGAIFDEGPWQPQALQAVTPVSASVPNPTHLLRDVAHLRGFVANGRCELRQDGQIYRRSLQALGKALKHPEPTYPQFLWELCETAGFVGPGQLQGNGFISPDVENLKPGQLYRRLLDAWSRGRPSTTRTQGGQDRTHLARERLRWLLANVPGDTWVLKSSVESLLAFLWPVIFTNGYAQGADPPPEWASGRHLALAEGVTADGKAAVMVPSSLQPLLRGEQAESRSALPPWDNQWVVQPDRSVIAPPNAHPKALRELWTMAQLEDNQGAAVFRITAGSIAAALNDNHSPEKILETLRRRSRTPLPPTVERLIHDQGQRYGQVKVGHASAYIRTENPGLLEELLRNPKLRGLGWRVLAPGVACLVNSEQSGALNALRRAGYLPVFEQPASRPGSGSGNGQGGRRGNTRNPTLTDEQEASLLAALQSRFLRASGRPRSAGRDIEDV